MAMDQGDEILALLREIRDHQIKATERADAYLTRMRRARIVFLILIVIGVALMLLAIARR
jgi:hypothetical protein